MKTLRNELYNQIEKLENQLKGFDSDQYGFSNNVEALIIGEKINDLETEISNTWIS